MKSLYNFFTKHGQTFAFGLGGILSVLYYVIVFGGLDSFDALAEDAQGTSNIFNFGLYISFILVIVAFVALLVFGVMRIISNIRGSIQALIAIVVIVVLFFILYGMADPSAVNASMADTMKEFNINAGTYKGITAAIGTAVTLCVLSVVALVYSAISNQFK